MSQYISSLSRDLSRRKNKQNILPIKKKNEYFFAIFAKYLTCIIYKIPTAMKSCKDDTLLTVGFNLRKPVNDTSLIRLLVENKWIREYDLWVIGY